MFMVARVPDFVRCQLACSMRIATFDELDAARGTLIHRGRDEQMNVVGHYGECMYLEFAGIAIAKECGDEELGVCGVLKVGKFSES